MATKEIARDMKVTQKRVQQVLKDYEKTGKELVSRNVGVSELARVYVSEHVESYNLDSRSLRGSYSKGIVIWVATQGQFSFY